MSIHSVEIALLELKRICKENPEIKYFYVTHVREGKIEVEWESSVEKVNIPGDGGSALRSLPIGESFRCDADDVEYQNFISAFMGLCLGEDITIAPFAKLAPSSHSQVDTVITELRCRLKGKEEKLFFIYHDKHGDISFSFSFSKHSGETIHAAINGRVGLGNLPKGEWFQCSIADLTNKYFIEELGKLIEGKHVSYHMGRSGSNASLPKEGSVEKYDDTSIMGRGLFLSTAIELLGRKFNNGGGDGIFYVVKSLGGDIVFTDTISSEKINSPEIEDSSKLSDLKRGECFECKYYLIDDPRFIHHLKQLVGNNKILVDLTLPEEEDQRGLVSSLKTGPLTRGLLPTATKENINGFDIDDIYRVVSFFNPGVNKESIQTLLELIKMEKLTNG